MRDSEYKKRIIDYVKKNLRKGYTLESLKWALVDQGYSRTLVDLAIKDANLELSKEAPVLQDKPMITHEIIGENDQPVEAKKSWWRRFFGL
ncbi:MAG: hypothetical protein ABSG05_01720 [Candidatus Pacearchaeota archaeon]|jgi:hypothetical protein